MKVQPATCEKLNDMSTQAAGRYAEALADFLANHWQQSAYENNYQESHKQAIRTNFPVCAHLFEHFQAEPIFDELLTVYVRHTRERHWDINQFGASFPAFLSAQSQSSKAESYPWQTLSDIANIEATLIHYYYGGGEDNEQTNLLRSPSAGADTSETYALVQLLKQFHPYLLVSPQLLLELDDNNDEPNLHALRISFSQTGESKIPRLTLHGNS
ncbi:MAG: hypothetical protein CL693_11005 [Cellvibrionaceae bacterium]|nr:hypothetical protein [Cellvibrionaceae bacterium]|tara:strand:+ start:66669 stop:67310 length:642 start_codon:yes stop_codon:yes gene_type:complete